VLLFPFLNVSFVPDRFVAWFPPRVPRAVVDVLEPVGEFDHRRVGMFSAIAALVELAAVGGQGVVARARGWSLPTLGAGIVALLTAILVVAGPSGPVMERRGGSGSLVVVIAYSGVALLFAAALASLRHWQDRKLPRSGGVSRRAALSLLAGAGVAQLAAIASDQPAESSSGATDVALLAAPTRAARATSGLGSAPALAEPSGREDALTRRVLHELAQFVGWLQAGGVQGYVGELGWPNNQLGDAAAWNRLVERWYQAADAAGLWVTVWDTGEQRTDYKLAAYKAPARWQPVSRVDTQAAVLEAHPETPAYRRGINVTSGTEGRPWQQEPTGGFSNASPGTYGREYRYESQQTFDFLASRGIRTVRLACYWERLQRQLGGELHPGELDQLLAAVDRAAAAGLGVILNLHNFGGYYLFDGRQGVLRTLGDGVLRVEHFADFWARLSAACVGRPGLVGYGLMNEPVYMGARAWEQQAQAALDAIRATGDATTVLVPGYRWSLLSDWVATHPQPWIADPTGNFRYEAHHYLHASPGLYDAPYPAEVTLAEKRGW
jgi:hypothetical protein